MIFTQHYLDCLSQASYLIGDETTGRAVVVDPRRDIDDYLSEAAEHGWRIEGVIETHIHVDFWSGHLELAAATGALISYGEDAEVEFPIEPLRDASGSRWAKSPWRFSRHRGTLPSRYASWSTRMPT